MPGYNDYGIWNDAMERVNRLHFVGIGGAGMSGIAEVLHNLGYEVSGSDTLQSQTTGHLSYLGISVGLGHSPERVEGCDAVIFSSAIADDNVELLAARERGIPLIPRAEMLAELMRFRQGIAIAGTHGKTTVTSLAASIFAEGGFDPTYVIGGLLSGSNSRARLGAGKYLIAEADESDASFLHLQPIMAVLTNIDADHLENHGDDISCLQAQFLEFLHHLPFYGLAIICLDDPRVRKIKSDILRPFKTYGFDEGADYFAHHINSEAGQSYFQVSRRDCKKWLQVKFNLPGEHNVMNALAAIAVAHEVGVSDSAIVNALSNFQGITRRCEMHRLNIEGKDVMMIDDYAHHPREISAMLKTAHEILNGRRIILVFQPHRYTRTMSLFDDFCQILSMVDSLFLLEVYSAGEQPVAGINSKALCQAIRRRGQVEPIFIEQGEQLPAVLINVVEAGDLLMVLGAGDISLISSNLVRQYGVDL